MTIDSTDKNEGNSFEYRLKEVSDEEIVNILRFREHYQPQAIKAAIREALHRGIIESVDDLEKEEFKQPSIRKSFFPVSYNENQNYTLFKSLCRICYLFGIIPSIYGGIQLANKQITHGIIAILIGISFMYLTYNLEKGKKIFHAQLMLIFNIPAIVYAIYWLKTSVDPAKTDYLIAIVCILILLYTTLFIYKLTTRFKQNL
ncbi:MAG TPA: hypothetical protein PKH79_09960 [Prolixibacteraceae bacterium]|nr:hypothetical protein [Prolixibacteraceae bacterium]HPS12028.1 hypothetical protein [Prolixibacteraceae bacterium]